MEKFSVGKWRGRDVSDVPTDYLRWYLNCTTAWRDDRRLWQAIDDELQRRKQQTQESEPCGNQSVV